MTSDPLHDRDDAPADFRIRAAGPVLLRVGGIRPLPAAHAAELRQPVRHQRDLQLLAVVPEPVRFDWRGVGRPGRRDLLRARPHDRGPCRDPAGRPGRRRADVRVRAVHGRPRDGAVSGVGVLLRAEEVVSALPRDVCGRHRAVRRLGRGQVPADGPAAGALRGRSAGAVTDAAAAHGGDPVAGDCGAGPRLVPPRGSQRGGRVGLRGDVRVSGRRGELRQDLGRAASSRFSASRPTAPLSSS